MLQALLREIPEGTDVVRPKRGESRSYQIFWYIDLRAPIFVAMSPALCPVTLREDWVLGLNMRLAVTHGLWAGNHKPGPLSLEEMYVLSVAPLCLCHCPEKNMLWSARWSREEEERRRKQVWTHTQPRSAAPPDNPQTSQPEYGIPMSSCGFWSCPEASWLLI